MAYPACVVHGSQGSVTLPLTRPQAEDLQRSLENLARTWQGSPPYPLWEVQMRGEVTVELFCNPNIWPSRHGAQVLLTAKTPLLKVSFELPLTQLLEDVGVFLAAG
ncbi:MAG: hypothetical protein Q6K99_04065 [Thermostichales cyanobacterium BF4_bins_65]